MVRAHHNHQPREVAGGEDPCHHEVGQIRPQGQLADLPEEYPLPEKLRSRLAKPLGVLYRMTPVDSESFATTVEKARMVITVGDRVTETVARLGRVPDVQIVDGKENRKKRTPPKVAHLSLAKVKNPAGTITLEAMDGIREAFRGKKPARVLVEGEEDLLAIPAVIFAPLGAAVYYGQPGEGIVMLRVDEALKARNRALLKSMRQPDATKSERT